MFRIGIVGSSLRNTRNKKRNGENDEYRTKQSPPPLKTKQRCTLTEDAKNSSKAAEINPRKSKCREATNCWTFSLRPSPESTAFEKSMDDPLPFMQGAKSVSDNCSDTESLGSNWIAPKSAKHWGESDGYGRMLSGTVGIRGPFGLLIDFADSVRQKTE